jgi:type IV secretion system protein VirB3
MQGLKTDIVFGALTRPQIFAGVTYGFFVFNAIVTMELFLLTRSFLVLLASAAMHAMGTLACLKEPRIFDIRLTRLTRAPRIRNWSVWRCNSYTP